jgi:hypothetical protein
MPALSAHAIKITLVLDPVEVFNVLQQVNTPDARVPFTINVEGRQLRTTLADKSVRKCFATPHQHGPQAVAVIIPGKLGRSDEVMEAGLVAQLRVRPAERVAAA